VPAGWQRRRTGALRASEPRMLAGMPSNAKHPG